MGAIYGGEYPGGFWTGNTPVKLAQGHFRPGDRRTKDKDIEASSPHTQHHPLLPHPGPFLPLVLTASDSSVGRTTAPSQEVMASSYP